MLFEELTEITDPEPHDAALNMAIDEALFNGASGPILRVYQWLRPSVSFGYFGRYDAVAKEWDGRGMVRRWTGGGVVPHGEDITYTLIAPGNSDFSRRPARESYRMIHERIAGYLARKGHRTSMTGKSGAKISEACFDNPVASDLMVDGSKIAGAAQRRSNGGLLHQGSIKSPGVVRASCEDLASAFAPRIMRRELHPAEVKAAHVIAAEKYATEAWLKKFR